MAPSELPGGFEPAVPFDRTFDAHLGLEVSGLGGEVVEGRLEVGDHHKQPYGIVHGGVLTSIAESLASAGTAAIVVPQGNLALGLSNQASFLRPVTGGVITAQARPCHRGRTTWVWDVDLSDDEGRLCAVVRMTIAVRPIEPPQPGAGQSSSGA